MVPEHSPEPWKAVNHPLGVWVTDVNGEHVNLAEFDAIEPLIGRANLNRVVACMNACRGLPTATLEAAAVSDNEMEFRKTLSEARISLAPAEPEEADGV